MRIAARLNGRITELAVGQHLPYRTVRTRLTLVYGGVFLLSGAALMAITYLLLTNAGFVLTLQNDPGTGPAPGQAASVASTAPSRGLFRPGSVTHASAQTMAHWRVVAQCMRKHGLAGFPNPTNSVPPNRPYISEVSYRDGAIFPSTDVSVGCVTGLGGVGRGRRVTASRARWLILLSETRTLVG
jgi:hypothetical protein